MTDYKTKSSGKNDAFETGATRDARTGKGRFDLIPGHPLLRLAQLYERGGLTRGDRNWEKGVPLSRFVDSAFRHLVNFMSGDRSEDHLIAVAWNVFGYVWTEKQIKDGKLPKELGDFGDVE